jgi:hypothetical protein
MLHRRSYASLPAGLVGLVLPAESRARFSVRSRVHPSREAISEVPLGERAAGSGLQVAFETRGVGFLGELQWHDDRPRPVILRVAARTVVVPREPFVNIRGAANVVALGIAIASQDVNESDPDTSHDGGQGIVRAKVDSLEMLGIPLDRTEGTRKTLVLSVGT